jgi:hypothetical protein
MRRSERSGRGGRGRSTVDAKKKPGDGGISQKARARTGRRRRRRTAPF